MGKLTNLVLVLIKTLELDAILREPLGPCWCLVNDLMR